MSEDPGLDEDRQRGDTAMAIAMGELDEEEALEQGLMSCALCERWGTVPGSTRCQDCQEADEAL